MRVLSYAEWRKIVAARLVEMVLHRILALLPGGPRSLRSGSSVFKGLSSNIFPGDCSYVSTCVALRKAVFNMFHVSDTSFNESVALSIMRCVIPRR